MKIEREIMEGKFDIVDRNVRFLEEMKKLSPQQFMDSYRDAQPVKYSLLQMEACIDVANYIISVKGFDAFFVFFSEGFFGFSSSSSATISLRRLAT